MELQKTPERKDLKKAYVYDRMEGTQVLSEGIPPIDDRTLLTIPFPENRALTFIKNSDSKVKEEVEKQLQAKNKTLTDDDLILIRLIPADINSLMKTRLFHEKTLETKARLDRIK